MNRFPKEFYRVNVTDRGNLKYKDRGSATFTTKLAALKHMDWIVRYKKATAELWHTEVDWKPVASADAQLEGQEPLW